MSPRLRRTVAVTGSASGIGAAVRARFEHSGTRVVGVDLHDQEIAADLATDEGRRAAVADVADRCDGRLDGLVACAGIGPHVSDGGRIVSVNYFGTLAVLDGLLAVLADGEAPAAVAICSNAAGLTPRDSDLLEALDAGDESRACRRAAEVDGATTYGMSKLALARAVRRRAGDWGGRGVRLNGVCPGPVDTPLLAGSLDDPTMGPLVEALPVPLGRRAAPPEIASAVAFLLDPANGYVHGSLLWVDGGSDALIRPEAV